LTGASYYVTYSQLPIHPFHRMTDANTSARAHDVSRAALRARLVLGNWKMHGSLAENAGRLAALRASAAPAHCQVGVCVPFTYLNQAAQALQGSAVSWGAQDVSAHDAGAYTGEVSAAMLADFGCRWALAGHSERRAYHGETDQVVADKARAALQAGLTPVVCVGETLAERESGSTFAVIHRQLAPVVALGAESVSRMVVAYEPVWAIGTGRSATPEQAQEVHLAIRQALPAPGAGQVQVIYGGSVKAANAASLFAMPDIDGALVGGASLVAEEFLRIVAA
jgi:triosephosphate isomerase